MTASGKSAVRVERDLALSVRRVRKTYRSESGDEVHALDEVDLTIQEGDLTVLIAPGIPHSRWGCSAAPRDRG